MMPVLVSSAFRNSRSVLIRRTLPKGRYVVVVCTFEPGVIGSFLFRVYTGSPTKVRYVYVKPLSAVGYMSVKVKVKVTSICIAHLRERL